MKNLDCEICGSPLEADTFEGWLEVTKVHWMENHQDVMEANKDRAGAMEEWMIEARRRWDAA